MTSNQESSRDNLLRTSSRDVETLAGVFHPHAIEVQDFSYYALIIDARSQAEFDDDHIPGSVSLARTGAVDIDEHAPSSGANSSLSGDSGAPLPDTVEAIVASVKLDQAILVYCGRGGRDSLAIAQALRWRGWTVDVLPGGWNNYRRWVEAGLEALPRLVGFRVVMAPLGSEIARLLAVLARAGEQVLDVEALSEWRMCESAPASLSQPSQAMFESGLLQALRHFDSRRPVWVADVDRDWGCVALPGALIDAVAASPSIALSCPFAERLARWHEDKASLGGGDGDESSMARLLADRDEQWRMRQAFRESQRLLLPPIVTDTLELDSLAVAISEWLRTQSDALKRAEQKLVLKGKLSGAD